MDLHPDLARAGQAAVLRALGHPLRVLPADPKEPNRRRGVPLVVAFEVPVAFSVIVTADPKAHLKHYLQTGRDAMLWKLDGLDEYDVRRPLTPTGTNLLGLLKHLASVEAGYFGATFDRPFPEPLPWFEDDAEPNADMWAAVDESRDDIVGLYRRASAHSDETIDALALDSRGRVPWWPQERAEVTLHQVLVHNVAETHRHAGHADIVRELVDGSVGHRRDNDNMAPGDEAWWARYRERLEEVAKQAAGRGGPGRRAPE